MLNWQSEIEFRQALADKLQVPVHSISLDEERGVMRPSPSGPVQATVPCLKIRHWEGHPSVLVSVLADYMRYQNSDYYRITADSDDAPTPTRVVYSTANPDFRFISHHGESQDIELLPASPHEHGSLQSMIEEVSLEAGVAMEEAGDILVTDSSGPVGAATTGQ
ncbi:MAG TPA: hypothetical protein VFE20_02115 [Thermoleophilia bacterium]|nr:hypothetical protein [Thermoleophilia bacterium]